MSEMPLAIRFEHFIETNRRSALQNWADSHARGDYVFDSGGWRDYAPESHAGIEFEREDDALAAFRQFGGKYYKRKVPTTDDGQKNN